MGRSLFPGSNKLDDEEERAAYTLFIERLIEAFESPEVGGFRRKGRAQREVRHALLPAAPGVHRRGAQARPRHIASQSAGQQRLPRRRQAGKCRCKGGERRMMKKQFYLEGERITLRCAKELIGREQYKKTLSRRESRLSVATRCGRCGI